MKALLEEKGMQINYVDSDAFVAASEPVWEEYRDTYGEYIDRIREVVSSMS